MFKRATEMAQKSLECIIDFISFNSYHSKMTSLKWLIHKTVIIISNTSEIPSTAISAMTTMEMCGPGDLLKPCSKYKDLPDRPLLLGHHSYTNNYNTRSYMELLYRIKCEMDCNRISSRISPSHQMVRSDDIVHGSYH